MTFWEGVDRIRREAGLEFAPPGSPLEAANGGSVVLAPRDEEPSKVASASAGLFRVSATEIDDVGGFLLYFEPEPRLFAIQDGPLRLLEATDDKGRSLIPEDNPEPGRWTAEELAEPFSLEGALNSTRKSVFVRLKLPRRPGAKIRVLRGVLPLINARRERNPVAGPLLGGGLRTFQNGSIAITPISVDGAPMGMHLYQAEVAFRLQSVGSGLLRPRMLVHQIDVLDGAGRVFKPIGVQVTTFRRANARLQLLSNDIKSQGKSPKQVDKQLRLPASLLLYRMMESPFELAFELRGLPLPYEEAPAIGGSRM